MMLAVKTTITRIQTKGMKMAMSVTASPVNVTVI